MPYEENRETITRIKRTNNLAFNEIESESSARRAKSTIPCQAEGSGENVRTRAEDAAKTDIQEQKDQFLSTVERLLKPSGKKETCHWRRKEKKLGWRKCVVDGTKWPRTVMCCGKTFPGVGCLDTT